MNGLRAFGLVICVGLVAVATVDAQPPPPAGDHYLSYREVLPQPGAVVIVNDQFIPTLTIDLLELDRFLNPVSKNNEPIFDPNLHYTWWDVQPNPVVDREVVVRNQFGEAIWQVSSLEFLLAPSLKQQQGPLPAANHYLCYRAQGPTPDIDVILQDQFQSFITPIVNTSFLCNPCEKNHDGVIFPIVDPKRHLAVYEVLPPPFVFTTLAFDQFGDHQLLLDTFMPPEWLFVPSLKDEVIAVEPKSWGRIKSLFRDE